MGLQSCVRVGGACWKTCLFHTVCLVFTARTCSVSNLCTCKRHVFGVTVLCTCGWRVLEICPFRGRLHCIVSRSVATSLDVAALFSVPGRAVFHTGVRAKEVHVQRTCMCKRPVFGVAVLCACGWRVLENVSFSCRLHCVVTRSVATSLVVAALFSVPGRAVFHTRVCAKGRVIRGGPCVWYSACCAQNSRITGTAHCAVSVFVLWRLTLYNCRQTTPPRCPLFRRLCIVVDWMKVISGPKSRIQ